MAEAAKAAPKPEAAPPRMAESEGTPEAKAFLEALRAKASSVGWGARRVHTIAVLLIHHEQLLNRFYGAFAAGGSPGSSPSSSSC